MSNIGDGRLSWRIVGVGLTCPVTTSPRRHELHLFARTATGELRQRELHNDVWSDWRSLGVPVAPGAESAVGVDWQLTACSNESGRIDLFGRSPDGDLVQKTWDGTAWDSVRRLGSPAVVRGDVPIPMGLASTPAACTTRQKRMEVFAVGHGGDLLHTAHDGRDWSEFVSLGAPEVRLGQSSRAVPALGPPSACGSRDGHMAVFVRGPMGDILLKWWDRRSWSNYASLGMPEMQYDPYPGVRVSAAVTGPPAACSSGPERIDVFARGPHGSLLHKWWDGDQWSHFTSLGMPSTENRNTKWLPFTGTVAACSSGPGRLDVFATAIDGNLYHRSL